MTATQPNDDNLGRLVLRWPAGSLKTHDLEPKRFAVTVFESKSLPLGSERRQPHRKDFYFIFCLGTIAFGKMDSCTGTS